MNKIIADTMLWRYAGDNPAFISEIAAEGETLFYSPVSVLELANQAVEGKLDAVRPACRAILDSKATILPHTESILCRIFQLQPLQTVNWPLLVMALANNTGYDADSQQLSYTVGGESSTYPLGEMNRWNKNHEEKWRDGKHLDWIENFAPSFKEWHISTPDSSDVRNMPAHVKQAAVAFLKDSNGVASAAILRSLLERGIDALQNEGVVTPPLSAEDIKGKVEASIHPLSCYTAMYRQYLIRQCSGRTPKANDRWDSEFFIYLDDDHIFATAEKWWKDIAAEAGCGQSVRHIKAPSATDDYDFRAIESKWQARWEEWGLFRVENSGDKDKKFYGLDFFPYPSGAGISVGHCRNYVPLDAVSRLKNMQGFNVLHPMGWDAFGQPAENEAIKRGRNPKEMVPEYAANYKRQLQLVGISYDWSREINSSAPDYYKWTQWIFLLLYKRGLAYRSSAGVNWCPNDKTVLANEEVVNGRCWRCNTLVEKRYIPQWFFKITDYAERLLSGLDTVDWPDGIRNMQREWIGRSEGAEVTFKVIGNREQGTDSSLIPHPSPLNVFTTRPDTLWGATFMVLAPEHPLVEPITTPEQAAAVREYKEKAQRASEIERQSLDRTKTGVFTGAYAENPVTGEPIPIWIADYVLMGYGTGAIMAVPAHDQRDFEFARKYDIPVVLVYKTDEAQTADAMTEAIPAGGVMANFTPAANAQAGTEFPFAGLPNNKETVGTIIHWLEERGVGRGVINYRLRDWLISRQRYWGAPTPIIHCPTCGTVPVPDDQLPVLLPDVEKYQPTGTGESPLAGIPEFVNTTCPQCGEAAKRETDTMGGTACSSWYFLRFADPNNAMQAFDPEIVKYWLPVDLYVGGAEHAVSHLLYSRFWTKVIHDAGYINFDEPFLRLKNQGMVLANTPGREIKRDEAVNSGEENEGDEPIEDWKVLSAEERQTLPQSEWVWRWTKMSKSKGNVVTPDEMAREYGADSLRLFGLFVAPFEETVQWTDKGIEAASKFVHRVWRLWTELRPHYQADWEQDLPSLLTQRANSTDEGDQNPLWLGEDERKLRRKLHQTIRKVGDDLENFRFNTAVAALMELTNELSAFRNALAGNQPSPAQAVLLSEILETLPLLMSPITPHVADEWWERLGKDGSTFRQKWPESSDEAAKEDEITIVVQVNGKLRDRVTVAPGTTGAELERLALASEKVQAEQTGKQIRKIIVVPDKLVNIVMG